MNYPRRTWWLLFAAPLLFWASVPLYSSWSTRGAFLAVGLAALVRALAAFFWRPQTVVAPEGLRVREGWRSREVAWADVESVHTSGRWQLRREVTVLVQNGPWMVLPGLPEARTDEVREYWARHCHQN